MARIFHSGFEWQALSAEFSTPSGGGESISTADKNGGAASLRCTGSLAASAFMGVGHNMTMATDVYYRVYIKIHSIPNDGGLSVATIDLWSASAAANALSLQIGNESGTLVAHLWVNAWGTEITNTASFQFDVWHCVEIYYKSSGAAGADQVVMKLDGTQVASNTSLTLTSTPGYLQVGFYNGSASTITTEDVYFDDIAINTTSGSVNNSWCGAGKIVISVPRAAGEFAADTGVYSNINEIPPSDTATEGGSNCIELATTTSKADYLMTLFSSLGIESYDTINAISVLARIREKSAGTSNYTLRIKGVSGGTVTSNTSRDAGNATPRTNPNSTTAFGNPLISETNPTTGAAWSPSLTTMECGVATTDGNPETWCLALAAMIDYTPGTAPSSVPRYGFVNHNNPAIV